jgi:hypothetical protein
MEILEFIKNFIGLGEDTISGILDSITIVATGSIEFVTDVFQTVTPNIIDMPLENTSEIAKEAVTKSFDFVEGVLTTSVDSGSNIIE